MMLPDTPAAARAGTWEPGSSFVSASEGPSFADQVNEMLHANHLNMDSARTLLGWQASYTRAAALCPDIGESKASSFAERAFRTLLMYLIRHRAAPIHFAPYHEALSEYYAFRVRFLACSCRYSFVLLCLVLTTCERRSINYH